MRTKQQLLLFFILFFTNQLFSQHDTLFHNYQLGIKFGGTYTLTDTKIDERFSSISGNEQIFHETGTAEGDYGYNLSAFGLFKVNNWLNLQAEINFMRISAGFDYNNSTVLGELGIIENTYLNLDETAGTGFYELKELYLQFPIMAKVLVGKDWQFAFGAGAYFRGGGFSNSTWSYDKRKYFREITDGNFAPEDPPLVTNNISDKVKLVKDSNFGFIVDLGVIRPLNKTQSLFLEFRYQQPFSEESEIPYLKQKTIVASIGFMTKILRPAKEDEFIPDDGFQEDEEIKKLNRKKKREKKEEKDDF